tara:strand:+ start:4131 stop:4835 length:705 start_codon:yes stop_codon:yes gene_type:complete
MKELLNTMRQSMPRYNIIQPSTGKMITFKPFTVKEEKTLLIANQTGSYEDFLSTLADIIDNCFDLPTPSKKLPLFDIEYFFLKLRSKSVGEVVEPVIICPETKESIKINLNIDEIEPIFEAFHSNEFKISNEILVKMKYPSLESLINNKNKDLDYFDLLIDSIYSIQTPNELIEASTVSQEYLKEFVELLTSAQYKKLIDFFKTSPRLETEVKYTTSDGTDRVLMLKGLRDFFQ